MRGGWGTVRVGVAVVLACACTPRPLTPAVDAGSDGASNRGPEPGARAVERRRRRDGRRRSAFAGGALPARGRGCPRGAVPGDRGVRSHAPAIFVSADAGRVLLPAPGPGRRPAASVAAPASMWARSKAGGEPRRPSRRARPDRRRRARGRGRLAPGDRRARARRARQSTSWPSSRRGAASSRSRAASAR